MPAAPVLPVVTDVSVLGHWRLHLVFSDGRSGTADLSDLAADKMPLLAPLRDPDYFARVRVRVETGTIEWPNGADLSREYLLEHLKPDPAVYVLHYWHKHGSDISLYATYELARRSIADIARAYWADAVNHPFSQEVGLPDSPDGLNDEDVARLYFQVMESSEGYEITETTVQGASDA